MPALADRASTAIVGHEKERERLRSAAAEQRLAHALLFAGPDGIGKRAVAIGLAISLQCSEDRPQAPILDGCGECAACRQVAAGSHPDVQLVGVPSGRKEIGIDRIRELKRFVQLRPVYDRGKVVVIDDAHMLTVAAQNALLKTLEEPPHGSLLILVASNADSLLPTVRSRCQRIQFQPLPTPLVERLLVERHGIDAAAARILSAAAEGSPGRALALRRSFVGERWEQLRQTLAALGSARYVHLAKMAQELITPETDVAIKLEALLREYRDQAVSELDPENATWTPLPATLRRADAVYEAWRTMRRTNPNRQLLLEALLLRLSRS